MLHNQLSRYLDEIEAEIRKLEVVYVERYEEEILASDRINLRIRVRFKAGNLFELNEAVIFEDDQLERLNYRYHLQDRQNNLIFRYDNTPHFHSLENFPHHKHLGDGIMSSEEPTVVGVIEEAVKLSN